MASLKENIEQEKAISTIYGPVIIISCPGSGKTTTLVRRLHRMTESGIDPSRILMVTFAAAAAKEMKERYRTMFGCETRVNFHTIHALCRGILVTDGVCGNEKPLSDMERMEIIYYIVKEYNIVDDAVDLAGSIATEITRFNGTGKSLKEYDPTSCEKWLFDKVVQEFEKRKAALGRIDFDDMLTKCRDHLRDDKEALARWQDRYQYIQCDEYQDTNAVQMEILYMLAGKRANLCVVGDDDQSIYRFRGADNSIMLRFEQDFQSRNVKRIMMSTNYRSAQKIVDMADMCIRQNTVRFEKQFLSDRGSEGTVGAADYKKYSTKAQEIKAVAAAIKAKHRDGIPYREMAILYRTKRQAAGPVQELAREGIPFIVTEKAISMYDGWMFQDIKAYIQLSMGINIEENRKRVLNHPNRRLAQERFSGVPYETESMLGAIEYLKNSRRIPKWAYTKAENEIIAWLNAFGPGKVTEDTPTQELIKKLTEKGNLKYETHIRQIAKLRKKSEQELLGEFEELKMDALKYQTVGEWLSAAERIRQQIAKESSQKDENGVCITTMHKSKGREWKAVFVIGVNEGIIPGYGVTTLEELEEERRILYVAMTRAKDELHVSCSGEESRFMEQTMGALKEKYCPPVRKKLAGAPVCHVTFGPGKVAGYTRDRIAIRFENGDMMKFVFPDAFVQGNLRYI